VPSYPGSAPALGTGYADATTAATAHAAAHNTVDDEVNAIGADLVAARSPASTFADRIQGGDFKRSCRVGSTANVTISPGGTSLTIDGVALVNGDRVFLKDQTLPAQNGIYVVGGVGSSVTLTRATDAATTGYLNDTTLITVEQGAANSDTAWEIVTDNPITIGTTPTYWTRVWPSYEANGPKNPWAASGAVMQNFERTRWQSNLVLPTAATWQFLGGGVLPAGRPVNNVVVYWGTAGAAFTIRHFSIVRVSDMAVLQRTANATSTPTGSAFLVTPLQAAYTSPVDVPIYIALGLAAGTAPSITHTVAASSGNILSAVPSLGYSAVTASPPTTTPPAVGAVLPAAGAGTPQTQVGCYYLT
jgi:hypothetical protein